MHGAAHNLLKQMALCYPKMDFTEETVKYWIKTAHVLMDGICCNHDTGLHCSCWEEGGWCCACGRKGGTK